MLGKLKNLIKNKKELESKQTDEILENEKQTARAFAVGKARKLTSYQIEQAFSLADEGGIAEQQAIFSLMEENDAHLLAEITKRKKAVSLLDWSLIPADDSKKAEDIKNFILKNLKNLDTQALFFDLLDAIAKGFSTVELTYKANKNIWVIEKHNFIPAHFFKLDKKNNWEQLLKLDSTNYQQLREYSWITHHHSARSGLSPEISLYRTLIWIYLYKTYSLDDWAVFLEKYAMPTRLGKYQQGIGEASRKELLRAVANLGNDSYGIISDLMNIEFIQPNSSSTSSEVYKSQIEHLEKLQSKAILGGTLTSQADGKTSTNALGKIHEDVRHELKEADAKSLANTINQQLIKSLVILNFGEDALELMPRFEFDLWQPIDRKESLEGLEKAVNLGLRIDKKYAHSILNIPQAEEDAEVLELLGSTKENKKDDVGYKDQETLIARASKQEHNKEIEDENIERLLNESKNSQNKLIKALREQLDKATSLEEYADNILQIAPKISDEKLAELVAKANIATKLAGRYEVREEIKDE